VTTWPRRGTVLPPAVYDDDEENRLNVELALPRPGSWAPRCRVDDPPAGILEMFGEYVELDGDAHLAVGWEADHPNGWRVAIRARLVRFRPDGTAAYLEARLPGPGWRGTWGLSIRGLDLERSAVRARIASAAVPLFRDWLQAAGRPSERAERVETYRAEILKLRAAGYQPSKITARLVLQRLGRSGDDSQLRSDVGGWAAHRARVLAVE
jgi:hypothetical protein